MYYYNTKNIALLIHRHVFEKKMYDYRGFFYAKIFLHLIDKKYLKII